MGLILAVFRQSLSMKSRSKVPGQPWSTLYAQTVLHNRRLKAPGSATLSDQTAPPSWVDTTISKN